MSYIRDIAENWLDWDQVEPVAREYQALIADAVATDTRKLFSTAAFETGLTGSSAARSYGGAGSAPATSLQGFIERRQAYVLTLREYIEPVEPEDLSLLDSDILADAQGLIDDIVDGLDIGLDFATGLERFLSPLAEFLSRLEAFNRGNGQ